MKHVLARLSKSCLCQNLLLLGPMLCSVAHTQGMLSLDPAISKAAPSASRSNVTPQEEVAVDTLLKQSPLLHIS